MCNVPLHDQQCDIVSYNVITGLIYIAKFSFNQLYKSYSYQNTQISTFTPSLTLQNVVYQVKVFEIKLSM